jgi:hypothetical protein
MEIPKLWNEKLANYTDVKAIIMELISQIKKDFSFFGEEIHFNNEAPESYAELFAQLEAFLRNNYSHKTEKLYPVLYRIDVLEKDIKNAINHINNVDFIEAITETVILKELQKVIIRRYYQEKNK